MYQGDLDCSVLAVVSEIKNNVVMINCRNSRFAEKFYRCYLKMLFIDFPSTFKFLQILVTLLLVILQLSAMNDLFEY